MRLHDDWRRILRRSWAMRLSILAAMLGAADVACSFLPHDPASGRGWLALLAAMVSLAAAIARIVAQSNLGAAE